MSLGDLNENIAEDPRRISKGVFENHRHPYTIFKKMLDLLKFATPSSFQAYYSLESPQKIKDEYEKNGCFVYFRWVGPS